MIELFNDLRFHALLFPHRASTIELRIRFHYQRLRADIPVHSARSAKGKRLLHVHFTFHKPHYLCVLTVYCAVHMPFLADNDLAAALQIAFYVTVYTDIRIGYHRADYLAAGRQCIIQRPGLLLCRSHRKYSFGKAHKSTAYSVTKQTFFYFFCYSSHFFTLLPAHSEPVGTLLPPLRAAKKIPRTRASR